LNNETQIQCNSCKAGWSINLTTVNENKYTFAKRWLPFHLTSATHIKFEKDRAGLIEAAKLFGKSISNEVLDVNEATTLNEPSKQ